MYKSLYSTPVVAWVDGGSDDAGLDDAGCF